MALTLQMASGDDNDAVFVLAMKSEGTNLVSYSDFSASTGWVLGGDWAIAGGVATYTYSANAAGSLSRQISAVSAISYVLEYEITAISGTGYALTFAGTNGNVASANIVMDITLGKHRLNFYGNSAQTTFKITASGFGAGDSISIDNVKMRAVDAITYLSTDDLSLDNTYDGAALSFDERISDIDEYMDVLPSGGIASPSTYTFTISRYSSNTRFDGFMNEFYPDYDGGYLISREVLIGVVWNTATTDTEITWLMRGRITDYQFTNRKLIITVMQATEFDNKKIPYYSIQEDFDNDISYFPSAPEENFGTPIPVVYGSFITPDYYNRIFALSPGIIINQSSSQVIFASHKCETLNASQVWRYIQSLNNYQLVTETGGSTASTNSDILTTVTMQASAGSELRGTMVLPLTVLSKYSDIVDVSNAIDRDYDANYVDVNGGEKLALRLGGGGSTSEVGMLSTAAVGHVGVVFYAEGNGGAYNITVSYRNEALAAPGDATGTADNVIDGTPAAYSHTFANSADKKEVDADGTATFPWRIEELNNLEYFISNDEAAGNHIFVYSGWLELYSIIINGIGRPYAENRYNSIVRRYVSYGLGRVFRFFGL